MSIDSESNNIPEFKPEPESKERRRKQKKEDVPVSTVYRAIRAFSVMLDSQMHHFEQNDIIADYWLITKLMENRCPIVPADDIATQTVCPMCGHRYIVEL